MVPYPAGTAVGDLLVIQCVYQNPAVADAPSGWTALSSAYAVGGGSLTGVLFYKTAGSSEPSTVTLPNTGSAAYVGGIMSAYVNVVTQDGANVSYTDGSTTGYSPGVSPAFNNDLVLRFYWKSQPAAGTITPLTDTERYDVYDPNLDCILELATEYGVYGSTTSTFSDAGQALSYAVAIAGPSVIPDSGTVRLRLRPSGIDVPGLTLDSDTLRLNLLPTFRSAMTFDADTVALKLTPFGRPAGVKYKGAGTPAGRGNAFDASPITPGLPSDLQVGDLMFLITNVWVYFGGFRSPDAFPGWTSLGERRWNGNYTSTVFYRVATGDDVAPTLTTGIDQCYFDAQIVAYTAVDQTVPLDVTGTWSATGSSLQTVTIPAITTLSAYSLRLAITIDVGARHDANSHPVGWTQHLLTQPNTGVQFSLSEVPVPNVGTEAAATYSRTVAANAWIVQEFAIPSLYESGRDIATASLRLTPSAVETYTAFTTLLDAATLAVKLTPSGTEVLTKSPGPTKRLLVQSTGSYIEYWWPTPITAPFWIEFSVEWTPDQWDKWAGSGGNRSSAVMMRCGSDLSNYVEFLAAQVGSGFSTWADRTALNGHAAPTGVPPDRRGKYSFRFEVQDTTVKITIDGVTYGPYARGGDASRPMNYIRFGWEEAFGYVGGNPGAGVHFDDIKIGTSPGGTQFIGADFNDGELGVFTPNGNVSVVLDTLPTDAATVPLRLTPKFVAPPIPETRRAFFAPPDPDNDMVYLEKTLPFPVGMGDGPIYGRCELTWLYGQSDAWRGSSPELIKLLTAADVLVDSIILYPDDLDWEFWADTFTSGHGALYVDELTPFPAGGKYTIAFVYEDEHIQWFINDISDGLRNAASGSVAKVQFGWTTEFNGSNVGAALFMDNIRLGQTSAYELVNENFEAGTPGTLTEVGTVRYPDNFGPGSVKYEFVPPGSGDECWIWYGPFGDTVGPVYIEFDVSWTATQQTDWGSYSGFFVFLTNRDGDWVEYLYHDTDGWWDNSDLFLAAPADDSGTHHIKMVQDLDQTQIIIDGTDTGTHSNSGIIDSVKFGWVWGGADLGGCTITNIMVGSTDGGTEYLAR